MLEHQSRQESSRRRSVLVPLTVAAALGLALVAPATGAAYSFFGGASSDGSKVFFYTDEQLVSADTDASYDIYERSGGTTTWISQGPDRRQRRRAAFAGASNDGSKVFFYSYEQLVSGDTDSSLDLYERSGRDHDPGLPGPGERQRRLRRLRPSTAPPTTARRCSSTPTSSWSAAIPTAPWTSTSAPAGRRPRSPRARSTATGPVFDGDSTPSTRRLRATARRSSSTPSSSWSAATPTTRSTSTSAPAGRRPRSPRARSTAARTTHSGAPPSAAPPATARRSSSIPASSWSAATPTDRQDIYERSGGTTTRVSQGQINGNGAFARRTSAAPRATARRSSSTPTSSWSAATPTAPKRRLRALRRDHHPGLPGPDQRQRRLRRRPSPRASSDGSKVFFDTQRAAGQRRHRQRLRRLRALRGDDHPGLPGRGQRQRRLRRVLRRRLERRLEGLLPHRRAAGQRRHRQHLSTSTSAPGEPRPRSRRARSTATASSTSPSLAAPRATARRSSSKR